MPDMQGIQRVVVCGANGALGSAFVQAYLDILAAAVYAVSRTPLTSVNERLHSHTVVYDQEQTLIDTAHIIAKDGPIDALIIANGFLHSQTQRPEKTWRQTSIAWSQASFLVNAAIPMALLRAFLPHMATKTPAYVGVLSARVGSISDNQLGGWYAYRAAKAALNMYIKTASIEWARLAKKGVLIGLHPGTVKSELSRPYQDRTHYTLFSPAQSVGYLLPVLHTTSPAESGVCKAWDGQIIPA